MLKSFTLAAATAASLLVGAGVMTGSAEARPWHPGWHRGWHHHHCHRVVVWRHHHRIVRHWCN
ncbi:MAG: hypothetical protein KGO53_01985 [Alphaproteobacteria bacterium]|nr:hypothetical protein [Alphaproteobacteria bacterium]